MIDSGYFISPKFNKGNNTKGYAIGWRGPFTYLTIMIIIIQRKLLFRIYESDSDKTVIHTDTDYLKRYKIYWRSKLFDEASLYEEGKNLKATFH